MQIPGVYKVIVNDKGRCNKHEGNNKNLITVAQKDTKGYTRHQSGLPSQKICALRCTTLAVFCQFDKEQKKARTHKPCTESGKQ